MSKNISFHANPTFFFLVVALETKANKPEDIEEEDDDVPGIDSVTINSCRIIIKLVTMLSFWCLLDQYPLSYNQLTPLYLSTL